MTYVKEIAKNLEKNEKDSDKYEMSRAKNMSLYEIDFLRTFAKPNMA